MMSKTREIITVFVIECESVIYVKGKESRYKEILGAYTEMHEAEAALQEILENKYGWNLMRFSVHYHDNYKKAFVKESDGDHYVYTIKEGELSMKDS